MERLKRAAIVTKLVDVLREAGSWCGETHVQKAMYLMQELLEVPTEYSFILYKHGPFSFDLSDELTSFRGDYLLELQPQAAPYGPRFAVTDLGHKRQSEWPKTLAKYDRQIRLVANAIGTKTVGQLERLATALFVTRRQTEHDGTIESRGECLHRLKPHVPVHAAVQAVKEIDELTAKVAAKE